MARFPSEHPLHARLAALHPGDAVRLEERTEGVVVLDGGGVVVAQLSRSGAETWRPRLARVRVARVIAVVRRRAEDVTPEYPSRCPTWELPVLEVEVAG